MNLVTVALSDTSQTAKNVLMVVPAAPENVQNAMGEVSLSHDLMIFSCKRSNPERPIFTIMF